jgi:hypothetical protein
MLTQLGAIRVKWYFQIFGLIQKHDHDEKYMLQKVGLEISWTSDDISRLFLCIENSSAADSGTRWRSGDQWNFQRRKEASGPPNQHFTRQIWLDGGAIARKI